MTAESLTLEGACPTPLERFITAFMIADEGTPFDTIFREAFPEAYANETHQDQGDVSVAVAEEGGTNG